MQATCRYETRGPPIFEPYKKAISHDLKNHLQKCKPSHPYVPRYAHYKMQSRKKWIAIFANVFLANKIFATRIFCRQNSLVNSYRLAFILVASSAIERELVSF